MKMLIESLQLKVELPMIVECDNKGAVNLANGWSVGGKLKHIDIRLNFVRELKENGVICVKWVPTEKTTADMHTKNLPAKAFEKHAPEHCGHDEYW